MTELLQNNIKKLDKPGRDKTIKLCNDYGWRFEEPIREDLAYDCIIKFDSSMFAVVEIKNRDIKCEKYDTLFLQKDKYENVKKWQRRLGADLALYINWIGDTCYVFDLSKVDESTLTEKWMNAITAESRTHKVIKQVYELKKSDAKILAI